MKSRFLVLFSLITVTFYMVSPIFISTVHAETAAASAIGKGRILHMTGTVQIKTPGDTDWKMPKNGAWLEKGSEIKTGPEATCDVGLGDNRRTVVRMDSNSRTILSTLDSEIIRVKLEEGRVWARVRELAKGSRFEVASPTAVATARGTGWEQSVEEVNVFENTVEVAGASGEIVLVEEGFGVGIDPAGDVKEPEKLPEERKGEWDNIEKQVEASIAEAASLPPDPGSEEPKTDKASADDPSKGTDDSHPGVNPPDDPNKSGDLGSGPNDMLDSAGGPAQDAAKEGPDAPENSLDSFGDGFPTSGFENPLDTTGGGPGAGDTLGAAKEEQHENAPPSTFDPSNPDHKSNCYTQGGTNTSC